MQAARLEACSKRRHPIQILLTGAGNLTAYIAEKLSILVGRETLILVRSFALLMVERILTNYLTVYSRR